jgi:hypothetical protein
MALRLSLHTVGQHSSSDKIGDIQACLSDSPKIQERNFVFVKMKN